jgi:hypothetical protein
MTLQRRIGIIFFTLSLITVAANFITIYRNGSLFNLLTCAGYMVVFSITIAWESNISKYLQIVCFLVSAFFSLLIDQNKMFGTSILVIEILVLYSYGFYKKSIIKKIIITVSLLFALLFVTIPQKNEAFMVFVFVIFIVSSIFMILYDELKKVYSALGDSVNFANHAMQFIRRFIKNG